VNNMEFDESLEKAQEEVKNAIANLSKAKASKKTKLKDIDPVTLAAILFARLETQQSTNLILKNLYAKIEKLEAELKELKEKEKEKQPVELQLLPEQDRKIIEEIKKKGFATADDIKIALNYKGRNSASSRLNKLYSLGILEKFRIGKKIYYKIHADAGRTTILHSF
jgi:predicted transcriptional regulator